MTNPVRAVAATCVAKSTRCCSVALRNPCTGTATAFGALNRQRLKRVRVHPSSAAWLCKRVAMTTSGFACYGGDREAPGPGALRLDHLHHKQSRMPRCRVLQRRDVVPGWQCAGQGTTMSVCTQMSAHGFLTGPGRADVSRPQPPARPACPHHRPCRTRRPTLTSGKSGGTGPGLTGPRGDVMTDVMILATHVDIRPTWPLHRATAPGQGRS